MPFVNIYATKDSYITNIHDSNNGSAPNLWLGRTDSLSSWYYRILTYFNLAPVMGKQITEASLRFYHYSGNGNDLTFSVHCITQSWSESTVTWANQPNFSDTAAQTFTLQAYPKIGSAGWRHFNVTSLIQDIVHNSRTYHGLLLRQPGSTYETSQVFTSRETWEGLSGDPVLVVYYKSGFRVRVDGSWRDGDTYVRDGGIWKPGTVYTRVDGTWRQGI
jgi:hypothetical protein